MKKRRISSLERKVVCRDCLLEERARRLEEEVRLLRHEKAVLLVNNRRLECELAKDELTGLKKTKHFEKFCYAAMHKHLLKKGELLPTTMKERRGKEGYFVVFVDLDGLKMANDTSSESGGGHEAGDTLLRSLAGTLMKRTRKYDVVVRLGEAADEFGVFLTGLTAEEARRRMEKIREHFEETACARCPALAEYFHALGRKMSFSFGIQEIDTDFSEDDIRNVIRRADDIMHAHKKRRRQDRRSMQQVCSMTFD